MFVQVRLRNNKCIHLQINVHACGDTRPALLVSPPFTSYLAVFSALSFSLVSIYICRCDAYSRNLQLCGWHTYVLACKYKTCPSEIDINTVTTRKLLSLKYRCIAAVFHTTMNGVAHSISLYSMRFLYTFRKSVNIVRAHRTPSY